MSETETCFDQRSQTPHEPGLRVDETRVGKGVFACRAFPVHSIIGEITGQRIDDPNYGSEYCMDLEDGYQLEPHPPFRFLNHSCEPNCEFDLLELDKLESDQPELDQPELDQPELDGDRRSQPTRRVYLVGLRDIHSGEELTINYNWPASAAIRCLCEAPGCLGWIIDESELGDLLASFADWEDTLFNES